MSTIALRNGKTLVTGGERHEREMGSQLTAQYELATGGMREVLKFGCMMMMLRAHLVSNLDTTQLPTAKASDGGIKKWLEEHAPSVQRSTAYRFEDVAKAVAQKFELPSRVAKQLTFEQLVTADLKQLDNAARHAQVDVFNFVAGTSQKSWLDQFREEGERGGDTSAKRKKLSPAKQHELFLKTAREDFGAAFTRVDKLVESEHWKAPSISDAELDTAVDVADRFVKEARQWLSTPKKQRTRSEIDS